MAQRLKVVLHTEVVLKGLWGSPEDPWESAADCAQMCLEEDWSSLLEEALGLDDKGLINFNALIQSAEWVEA